MVTTVKGKVRIISPVGQRATQRLALARRLETLNGKSIGFIDNIKPNAGLFKVKRFIWEHARIPFGSIPTGNLPSFSKRLLKLNGGFDPAFGVPIADQPEDIVIVVMGGTGTHSLSVQTRLASENITVPILCKDGLPWQISS